MKSDVLEEINESIFIILIVLSWNNLTHDYYFIHRQVLTYLNIKC